MKLSTAFVAALSMLGKLVAGVAAKPNIVFIFTDDQDYHHGSLDTQKSVQTELVAKGTLFTNHYATIAICCPSRVSLMRGQAAHNTNNTHVASPGGGYPKFVAAAEDDNYLPHWLVKAGYKAEYIGKLFNGNAITNYSPAPKGWSHSDILLDPYINFHDAVVMSENGQRPVWYPNYQQTDVVRIKSLSRLQSLLEQDDPFFLMIAPTAPHVHNITDPPIPPGRYLNSFENITVPRTPNFNPPDRYQKGKPSWIGELPLLNDSQINQTDFLYRRRLESLQGVDDIVTDVVKMLEENGAMDNTYIIYSTDQGYHLGTHRHAAGKMLPYLEDTNIPLVVRGPGVPAGVVSHLPGTVTDFAPTFLEIAGLADVDYPPFLDGASLLSAWKDPLSPTLGKAKEAINVEFWGGAGTEIPLFSGGNELGRYFTNTYKTMRIVGEKSAWLYSRWCTNDTELYNTMDDPYELENLANSSDAAIARVRSRLNALLMVTKSCAEDTCRHPWSVLQPPSNVTVGAAVSSLEEALDPRYDEYYDSLPQVTIGECAQLQFVTNEVPFYPPGAENGLGLQYRDNTDDFDVPQATPVKRIPGYTTPAGGWNQRHATLEMLLKDSRELTDEEIEMVD